MIVTWFENQPLSCNCGTFPKFDKWVTSSICWPVHYCWFCLYLLRTGLQWACATSHLPVGKLETVVEGWNIDYWRTCQYTKIVIWERSLSLPSEVTTYDPPSTSLQSNPQNCSYPCLLNIQRPSPIPNFITVKCRSHIGWFIHVIPTLYDWVFRIELSNVSGARGCLGLKYYIKIYRGIVVVINVPASSTATT